MDRRLASTTESLRFRVDATRCDGQGVCVLVAPELFALDRYGHAYVIPGADHDVDPEVRARGLEADALCPRSAIREIVAGPPVGAPVIETARSVAASPRLAVTERESIGDWRARGGFVDHPGHAVLDLVEAAGICGQGGAAFPTAVKWRTVAAREHPIVVVNGAEREPGTIKDRYLLTRRPGLVVDGIRLAMSAVGATQAVVAIDEESTAAHDALSGALDDASNAGLLEGLDIRIQPVPTRYVAGEETALISVLGGGRPLPRLRPPFPADSGLFGRPTVVNNVETLAQVAVATVLGVQEYRAVGTEQTPGTGLFSVGPFGGPYRVTERPFGYRLGDLLGEIGLLDATRAVLVGGYAGGLLTTDQLDVALTPAALNAAGASLGTKAIQVIDARRCPIGVAAEIVGYFGSESAEQCPPCSRGLPDMAALLTGLEDGAGGPRAVEELDQFMSTLFDRGVCRLPDGAARLTMSLLTNFADDILAHAESGCPFRQ
ncbi:NADH-ubiquinone oxidoreductase-F iron-sulfur binding region domain-containing protein [Mycobacterium intracellulare]|uniref:NADH-ubiquinone oxidoreductase-F iron-sulfur binding region domain-containing protein n=1 Tax=Mycobacterium intracellulare TaxID=1767 RepID=UPI0004495C2B|nr:NADH-ubiquinone oxidoreductase-F iron-sulfur binding region domain-containing protein [Mycobacterium intracellulare]ETZ39897.1 respiratory-chain NADH dehydrogenase 51 Kd subunit [Mycobacterium intracellulare MIN_061107_1834]MCA2273532.1 ferredoxin [Mycobacterium intracellulare]UEB24822.1 ferredoxin [Mycobacterium intracellulare]BCO60167.1 NADH dehydrogenase [Mycobacterium intracellulare]BCO70784.1 NADH dehydrogenase [Mycobacterium intracellulare]